MQHAAGRHCERSEQSMPKLLGYCVSTNIGLRQPKRGLLRCDRHDEKSGLSDSSLSGRGLSPLSRAAGEGGGERI
jgi:hypothetical protein